MMQAETLQISEAFIDAVFLLINPVAVIWPGWRQVSRCDQEAKEEAESSA